VAFAGIRASTSHRGGESSAALIARCSQCPSPHPSRSLAIDRCRRRASRTRNVRAILARICAVGRRVFPTKANTTAALSTQPPLSTAPSTANPRKTGFRANLTPKYVLYNHESDALYRASALSRRGRKVSHRGASPRI